MNAYLHPRYVAQHIYTYFLLRKLWPPFQNTKQPYFGVEQCNLFELFKSKSNTCKVYHVKTRPFLRYNFICSIGKRKVSTQTQHQMKMQKRAEKTERKFWYSVCHAAFGEFFFQRSARVIIFVVLAPVVQ